MSVSAFAPQLCVTAGVLGALGLGLMRRPPAAAVRALAVLAPAAALWLLPWTSPASLPPLLAVDAASLGWQLVIYAAALPFALRASGDDVEAALFLGVVLGAALLASSANAPMLFVSLELMSLPAYLLVARAGTGERRLEAAVKYFFAGSAAGALFMLGLALYYAESRVLGPSPAPVGAVGQAGLALMGTAALFKIGAFPLHWWLPDVYEASAPELAGFLSTAVKSAAVLFLLRVLSLAPNPAFAAALPWIGGVTAVLGALLALRQTALRRLLAYSSMSHAGLLVMGAGAWRLMGGDGAAAAALVFYLAAYVFMSNGAFQFLEATGASTRAELKGWASRDKLSAAAFAVLLFSLAGIPPTGGFVAKLLVLWQAVRAELYGPALLGALASLISLGYYLGLVRDMYFEAPEGAAPRPGHSRALTAACALGALLLGAAAALR